MLVERHRRAGVRTAQQNAVQAFYFANRFHDHLAAAPIGFTAAEGAFEGATTCSSCRPTTARRPGPDGNHINNANMYTPPDGAVAADADVPVATRPASGTMNGGDDASIVYHEYTHGLSNRLVTDADGAGALNSPQAGAMGEGWSDWYAKDFLVAQFPALGHGRRRRGRHGRLHRRDAALDPLRRPLDCPVGRRRPSSARRAGAGLRRVHLRRLRADRRRAEVHADGEIWAQTLWDLRAAVGSAEARALVTTGMRAAARADRSWTCATRSCSPTSRFGGADARRDLGRLRAAAAWASSRRPTGGDDTAPAENFALPPAAGAPRGTISGRVTNALGGAGVAGVTVGLAGGLSTVSAVTGADGRYTIADVPAGTYLKVLAGGGGWEARRTRSRSRRHDHHLQHDRPCDWAATKGGAT